MNPAGDMTFVGVDIGGTFARIGIVDALGRVLADHRTETPTGGDGDDLMRWVENAYRVCRHETDSFPVPEAMGVSVPGVLEPGRSAVVKAVNLPFLEGLPIRDRLVESTGLITVLDCDTVAAAWGEFCARERKVKRFCHLTIGTGVGAAMIVDAAVLRHTHHSAGHWGHVVCDTSDRAPLCRCGGRGCAEARIGAPALREAARAADLGPDIGDIELALHEGDSEAARLVEQSARYLAILLLDLARVYAPELIVVGGGVADGLPSLVRTASKLAEETGGSLMPKGWAVQLSALREYSGVVGAGLLAAEHLRHRGT